MGKLTVWVALAAAAALFFPFGANAATFNVAANVFDIDSMDGLCSLLEAVVNADDDMATHSDCPSGTGDDIIEMGILSTYTVNQQYLSSSNAFPILDGNLEIRGNGSILERASARGTADFRFFELGGGTTIIRNLTLENGQLTNPLLEGGGAIYAANSVLEIYFSEFRNNRIIGTGRGGAIDALTTDLLLHDTDFFDNEAAITASPSFVYGGGAVAAKAGTFEALRCAFVGNNADGSASVALGGVGGALLLEALTGTADPFDYQPVVLHSTISGNEANSGGGVAIVSQSGPAAEILLSLDYVTLVRNNATASGVEGILIIDPDPVAFVFYANSIIHSNGNIQPGGINGGNDCEVIVGSNPYFSGFNNLLGSNSNCPADITDFVTDVLADDLTVAISIDHHAPTANGVLIDSGSGNCIGGTTLDQLRRIRGNGPGEGEVGCDIGAAERYGLLIDNIFASGFENGFVGWPIVVSGI